MGLPLPISLLLVASGHSLTRRDETGTGHCRASTAAILGDNIDTSRSQRGRRFILSSAAELAGKRESRTPKLFPNDGALHGIFFSRWLITAPAPWINVTSVSGIIPGRVFFYGMCWRGALGRGVRGFGLYLQRSGSDYF